MKHDFLKVFTIFIYLQFLDFSDDEDEKRNNMQHNARRSANQSSNASPAKFRRKVKSYDRKNVASKQPVSANTVSTRFNAPPISSQNPHMPFLSTFNRSCFIPPPSMPPPPSVSNGLHGFYCNIPPHGFPQYQQTRFMTTPPPTSHVFNSVLPPTFAHPPPLMNWNSLNFRNPSDQLYNTNTTSAATSSSQNISTTPVTQTTNVSTPAIYQFPPPGFIPRSN